MNSSSSLSNNLRQLTEKLYLGETLTSESIHIKTDYVLVISQLIFYNCSVYCLESINFPKDSALLDYITQSSSNLSKYHNFFNQNQEKVYEKITLLEQSYHISYQGAQKQLEDFKTQLERLLSWKSDPEVYSFQQAVAKEAELKQVPLFSILSDQLKEKASNVEILNEPLPTNIKGLKGNLYTIHKKYDFGNWKKTKNCVIDHLMFQYGRCRFLCIRFIVMHEKEKSTYRDYGRSDLIKIERIERWVGYESKIHMFYQDLKGAWSQSFPRWTIINYHQTFPNHMKLDRLNDGCIFFKNMQSGLIYRKEVDGIDRISFGDVIKVEGGAQNQYFVVLEGKCCKISKRKKEEAKVVIVEMEELVEKIRDTQYTVMCCTHGFFAWSVEEVMKRVGEVLESIGDEKYRGITAEQVSFFITDGSFIRDNFSSAASFMKNIKEFFFDH